jgi:hypothetical protein
MRGPARRLSHSLIGWLAWAGMANAAAPPSPAPSNAPIGGLPAICSILAGDPLPKEAVLQRNPANGTVLQLRAADLSFALVDDPDFKAMQKRSDEAGIALCFLQAYGKLFRLDAPFNELRLVVADPEESGYAHVRLKQYYANLPVRDGMINVHLNPKRQVYLVEGRYYPTPSGLSTKPRLTLERATVAARDSLPLDPKAERRYRAQAAIYAGSGNRAVLAYRITVYKGMADEWEIWIDANTGAVLEKLALVPKT